MSFSDLRDYLLSFDIFVDNEYFDKYLNLVFANLNTKREKFLTASHHIIPRAYYKHNNIPVDDTRLNKVNLRHKDHLLAHYYMYKCAAKDYLVFSNQYAVIFMLNVKKIPEETVIEALGEKFAEDLYKNYTQRKSEITKKQDHPKGRKISEETRKKLSESHMGVKQTEEAKHKRSESLKRAYAEGRKVATVTQKQIELYKKLYTGKIAITNLETDTMKYIDPKEIDFYLSNGWRKGASEKIREQKIQRGRDSRGKPLSEKHRAALRVPKTISQAVLDSRKKRSIGYIVLTDGVEEKHISKNNPEIIVELLKQGWVNRTLRSYIKEKNMEFPVILDEGAKIPTQAHKADAGFDIYSREQKTIPAHGFAVFDTGVHIKISEGYVGMLKTKSGLNMKHSIIGTGVVDACYTGSIIVKLYNLGNEDYNVNIGDKIIQIVFLKINQITLKEAKWFQPLKEDERGNGGFGSTGV